MNKHAVILVTDTLGTQAICDALSVTPHAVRYARTTGLFSAAWYDELSAMCERAGVACPRDAFNWRRAAKKSGSDGLAFQEPPQKDLNSARPDGFSSE